jgi:hypothetical protein
MMMMMMMTIATTTTIIIIIITLNRKMVVNYDYGRTSEVQPFKVDRNELLCVEK